jgi:hypothetical protein
MCLGLRLVSAIQAAGPCQRRGGGFDLRACRQDKSARRGKQLGQRKSVPNTSTVRANDGEVCYKIDILSKLKNGLEMV